jgi:hypothetical protein
VPVHARRPRAALRRAVVPIWQKIQRKSADAKRIARLRERHELREVAARPADASWLDASESTFEVANRSIRFQEGCSCCRVHLPNLIFPATM